MSEIKTSTGNALQFRLNVERLFVDVLNRRAAESADRRGSAAMANLEDYVTSVPEAVDQVLKFARKFQSRHPEQPQSEP